MSPSITRPSELRRGKFDPERYRWLVPCLRELEKLPLTTPGGAAAGRPSHGRTAGGGREVGTPSRAAKVIWDAAEESTIGVDDIAAAKDAVEAKLDGSFFRVRAERTTELELALSAGDGRTRFRAAAGTRRGAASRQEIRAVGPDALAPNREGVALQIARGHRRPDRRAWSDSGRKQNPCISWIYFRGYRKCIRSQE